MLNHIKIKIKLRWQVGLYSQPKGKLFGSLDFAITCNCVMLLCDVVCKVLQID